MIKQLKFLNQKLNYMNQSFTNHALRPRPHSRLPQYLDHPKEGREGRQAGRQAGRHKNFCFTCLRNSSV